MDSLGKAITNKNQKQIATSIKNISMEIKRNNNNNVSLLKNLFSSEKDLNIIADAVLKNPVPECYESFACFIFNLTNQSKPALLQVLGIDQVIQIITTACEMVKDHEAIVSLASFVLEVALNYKSELKYLFATEQSRKALQQLRNKIKDPAVRGGIDTILSDFEQQQQQQNFRSQK